MFLGNSKILVTGGAGYLGRGILRRAVKESWRSSFTIYSRDETKQDICRRKYPDFRYILGDIRDVDRLETSFVGHDIVIHAAAVKYIPEAEINVSECIDVNVQGTRNVLKAARRAGVHKVICLSTDKAVQPVNVYGMTKSLVERLVAEEAKHSKEMLVTGVRYGNVVGSTGSVIPFFRKQVKDNGTVTVTDPKMTRYWLSINHAIDLIIHATDTHSGNIIIPDLKAMKMGDLAALIAGNNPVKVIGARPGEKQHESLLHFQESIRAVRKHANYELFPTTFSGHSKPFELVSNKPVEWLGSDEMLAYIEDAENV